MMLFSGPGKEMGRSPPETIGHFSCDGVNVGASADSVGSKESGRRLDQGSSFLLRGLKGGILLLSF